MNGTILITGAGGQVGQALANFESEHRLVALPRAELDITDSAQIERAILSSGADVVINAAAYTQVDRAEEEPDRAYAINRDGVANLASACREFDLPLLHISTDYVFAGDKSGAYVESDPVAPLGIYGKSKAEGEAALQANLERHIILRSSWVFSATGANFVKSMLRLGEERGELSIVADQTGCPTSARSIAEVLLRITERYLEGHAIEWGIYHYCNQPQTSWFEFAWEIFDQVPGFENLTLRQISTREYPTPAERPKNSVLECDKAEANFGLVPHHWKKELSAVLRRLSGERSR